MPEAVLNDAPTAGFFGKLPVTGDFVARGLPQGFRTRWDLWITRHLAHHAGTLPETGLRFRLVSGGRVAAGVIVPGQDSAGRRFPLSLILIGTGLPGPAALDPWLNAALLAAAPARRGEADADALLDALDAIAAPEATQSDDHIMTIWTEGHPAHRCDPADPAEAIRQSIALSCS